MHAEDAYLFRHAMLRTAAYELQPPSTRAELHAATVDAHLSIHGGNPPPQLAGELARHATNAIEGGLSSERLRKLRVQFLRVAIADARKGFRLHEVVDHAAALAELKDVSTSDRIDAFLQAAEFCDRTGQRERGDLHVRQAMNLLRDCPNPIQEFHALMLQSVIKIHQGDYPAAEAALKQLIHMDVEVVGPTGVAAALGNLAIVHREVGRNDLAEEEYRDAIDRFRDAGDRGEEGRNLGNLGNLYKDQGRHEEAERAYTEGLRLVREAEDPMTEGIILGNLSDLLIAKGRIGEAKEAVLQARVIQRRLGDAEGEAQGMTHLARAYAQEGDVEQAIETLKQAVAGLEAAESPLLASIARFHVAELLNQDGQHSEARDEIEQAESVLHRIGAKEVLYGQVTPKKVEFLVNAGLTPDTHKLAEQLLDEAESELRQLGLDAESPGMLRIAASRKLLTSSEKR